MQGDEPGGPIRWRMHLPVPPERVFAALDSNEGRAAFWAESAIEKDAAIHFRFIMDYQCVSPILERRPPSLWAIDYLGGEARFELTEDGASGTDLLLTHYGVPLEDWNETHAGWLNVLFPLKVWVVYGIDIRNHDPERSWNQGYADQ
jgi:uncharacterized protein YndB with AHSA1/START domain